MWTATDKTLMNRLSYEHTATKETGQAKTIADDEPALIQSAGPTNDDTWCVTSLGKANETTLTPHDTNELVNECIQAVIHCNAQQLLRQQINDTKTNCLA